MLDKLRRVRSRGRIGMLRGQGLINKVPLRVSWKSKKTLRSKRDSPTKFLLNSQGYKDRVSNPWDEVEIHQVRNLLVLHMVRSICVNVWLERVIALVVEIVSIK